MKDKLNIKFIDSLNGFRIKFTDSKLTKKWVGKQDTGHWEIYFEGKLVETADHPEINKVMTRLEKELLIVKPEERWVIRAIYQNIANKYVYFNGKDRPKGKNYFTFEQSSSKKYPSKEKALEEKPRAGKYKWEVHKLR